MPESVKGQVYLELDYTIYDFINEDAKLYVVFFVFTLPLVLEMALPIGSKISLCYLPLCRLLAVGATFTKKGKKMD